MNIGKNPHFIVTRPKHQEKDLVSKITKAIGDKNIASVSHLPLIAISSYNQDTSSLDSYYQGVIFISSNSVNFLKRLLSEHQWQSLLSNPLYAIGQQTAKQLQLERDALTELAIAKVKYPNRMDSEGLLSIIPLDSLAGQNWLIVKGIGGRQKLKQELVNAGAKVQEKDVYQRKLPSLEIQRDIATQSKSDPIWLITSLQALTNLQRILQNQTQNCRIIVSSDRIANHANKLGFQLIAQSEGATDDQLLATVQNIIQNPA